VIFGIDVYTYTSMPRMSSGSRFLGLGRHVYTKLSDDFRLTKGWDFNGAFIAVKGKKFFNKHTGDITFPVHSKCQDSYKIGYSTIFGPSCAHSGIIYDRTDNNMNEAVSRHFKKKVLEKKSDQDEVGNLGSFMPHVLLPDFDFDTTLRINQCNFVDVFGEEIVRDVVEQIGVHEYGYTLSEASFLLTLEKHLKQKLRIMSFEQIETAGKLKDTVYMDHVTWFVKMEIAKPKKAARIVVDLSCPGSLPRVHFANSFKAHVKEKPIKFGRVSVTYKGDASYSNIRDMFEEHVNHFNEVRVDNSSDDALVTWWEAGVRYTYLLDIASNDSSHSMKTMWLYSRMSNMDSEQQSNLFKSVRMPFRVYDEKKRRFIEFKSLWGYLLSGLGDTTVCNNCVYLYMGFMLNKLLQSGKEMSIALISLAGYHTGFRFSYQRAYKLGELQFLKHSPFLCGNNIEFMVNLGVILRFTGRTHGDIPLISYPKYVKNEMDRFRYFQSLLTFGFFKFVRYPPLIKSLCPFFNQILGNEDSHRSKLDKYGHSLYSHHFDLAEKRPVLYPSREEFYSRYNLSFVDIEEFESLMECADVGFVVHCNLIDVVLQADYGLSW